MINCDKILLELAVAGISSGVSVNELGQYTLAPHTPERAAIVEAVLAAHDPTPEVPAPNYEVPVGVYRKRIPAAVKTALLALAETDAVCARYLQSLAVYDAIDVDSPEHGAALDYLTTALAGGTGEITPDLRAALEAPL